eukprot:187177-Chlamydomonas_euryale.AAC.4
MLACLSGLSTQRQGPPHQGPPHRRSPHHSPPCQGQHNKHRPSVAASSCALWAWGNRVYQQCEEVLRMRYCGAGRSVWPVRKRASCLDVYKSTQRSAEG